MWFNNALIYQYELEPSIDLIASLTNEALKPCPPHARFTYGWLPTFCGELVQETSGSSLICMGKEERILPRGVINRLLEERIQALELQGRTVKRSEKAQLAEELEFELLPKSFCLQKRLPALLDHVSKRLIINSASTNQASSWISDPDSLPSSFQLASDCLLYSLDDEKKRFNCKGYELPAEEILTLLSQGLAAAEISIIWNERIQLTLTHDLTFKRLKCLDYLIDEFNDARQQDEEQLQQDAALTLLTGELRSLTNDLLAALTVDESRDEMIIEPQLGQEAAFAHD